MLAFPAAHLDKGEDPLRTARRELKEETGFGARKIEHIYTYHPSVSKSKQVVHVFCATGLSDGKTRHDGTEDIEMEIVAVRNLRKMIQEQEVENAGTLIAYLLCCTGMKIKSGR